MPKPAGDRPGGRHRCAWCGRALPTAARGRPRRYCRRSCRQRAYEDRRRAAEARTADAAIRRARTDLDAAHDAVSVLALAVRDAEADLAAAGDPPDARTLRDALAWVLEAARPVVALEPVAGRPD